MLPIILLPGEAVTLIEASVSHESGYLAARQDEKVEVLYVGKHDVEDEAGWIYVQRLGEDDRDKFDEKQGWIDTKLVKLDRRVGDKVIVGPNLQPAVYDVVQLICRSGDAVEVKHWGREDNEDERNWIYAEGPDQRRGWLHLESVEKWQSRSHSDQIEPRPLIWTLYSKLVQRMFQQLHGVAAGQSTQAPWSMLEYPEPPVRAGRAGRRTQEEGKRKVTSDGRAALQQSATKCSEVQRGERFCMRKSFKCQARGMGLGARLSDFSSFDVFGWFSSGSAVALTDADMSDMSCEPRLTRNLAKQIQVAEERVPDQELVQQELVTERRFVRVNCSISLIRLLSQPEPMLRTEMIGKPEIPQMLLSSSMDWRGGRRVECAKTLKSRVAGCKTIASSIPALKPWHELCSIALLQRETANLCAQVEHSDLWATLQATGSDTPPERQHGLSSNCSTASTSVRSTGGVCGEGQRAPCSQASLRWMGRAVGMSSPEAMECTSHSRSASDYSLDFSLDSAAAACPTCCEGAALSDRRSVFMRGGFAAIEIHAYPDQVWRICVRFFGFGWELQDRWTGPWHALLQDTDLLPFPNIAPERQSQYASYETRKVSITKGMVVQVEQYEDKWVKVKVSQGVCGWTLTSNLKADASQEPPPPPPSPPPAAAVKMTSPDASKGLPPKPSRPPPRASHVEPAPAPAVAECRDGRDGPALEPKAAATKLPPPPPPSESCPLKVSGQRPGRQPGAAQAGGALPQQAFAQISDADAAGGGSLGRIGLATFGLETLDGDLCSKCYEHPGGGAAYRASDEELNEALTRRKFPSEVILDARMFPDPDAGNVTRHSGRHYLIITRLFNHRNFKMWLERAKRKIEKAARDAAPSGGGSGSFNVAVYCRAGKHRSVAASVILHYILKAEGWTCPDVQSHRLA
eukprot:s6588_g2.t2